MAKELIYRVKIDVDDTDLKRAGKTAKDDLSSSLESVTNQALRLNDALGDKLEKTLREYGNAQKLATSLGNKFNTGLQATESGLQSYRQNQSRANQVLFSYGDLINDAQQFQFGFSNGLRAIGNNIGFAAEGISNLTTKAGGLGGAFKALGSSLLGPGGIILAINVAVTAFTVFGDTLFGNKDSVASKAEQAQERLKNLRNEIDRFQIQFEALSERQRELFPDQSQTESLRQQLELAGQIRESFEGRLATAQERRAEAQQFVDILDREVGSTIKARDLLSEQLITLEEFNRLSNDSVALSELLAEKQQIVKEATFDANSFQESVNSAKEKQIKLDARLNELLFIQSTDYFTVLDTAQKINDELIDIGTNLDFTPEALTADMLMQAQEVETGVAGRMNEKLLGNWASVQEARVNIKKDAEKQMTAIERIEAQQRGELQRQAISQSVNALSAAFDQFKPLAVATAVIDGVLAVQKVLANVPPPWNFAAAAAMGIATLKNVQKIISTEPGSASAGGGASTGSRGAPQQGFQTTEVQRRTDFSAIRSRDQRPQVVVEANNILPDTEFSIRAENGKKERITRNRVPRLV